MLVLRNRVSTLHASELSIIGNGDSLCRKAALSALLCTSPLFLPSSVSAWNWPRLERVPASVCRLYAVDNNNIIIIIENFFRAFSESQRAWQLLKKHTAEYLLFSLFCNRCSLLLGPVQANRGGHHVSQTGAGSLWMENTQRRVLVCCQIRNAQLRGHGKCGLYTVNRLWLLFVFVLIKKKEYVQVEGGWVMQKEKRDCWQVLGC